MLEFEKVTYYIVIKPFVETVCVCLISLKMLSLIFLFIEHFFSIRSLVNLVDMILSIL